MAEPVDAVTLADVVVDADEATFVEYVQLSQSVPVIVEVYAGQPAGQPSGPAEASAPLERLVRLKQGALLLVRVNALSAPEIVEALQVRALPALVAFIGGQLAPLTEGPQLDTTLGQIVDRVIEVAARSGVTRRISIAGDDEARDEGELLDENHRAAADALMEGDYESASDAYSRAIEANPADVVAKAGLAHIALVQRLAGKSLADIRQAAAAHPHDIDALCDVADLDLSGGHVEDACNRLLTAFATADQGVREKLRARLLDYFLIVGDADPRIISARTRLANLLF